MYPSHSAYPWIPGAPSVSGVSGAPNENWGWEAAAAAQYPHSMAPHSHHGTPSQPQHQQQAMSSWKQPAVLGHTPPSVYSGPSSCQFDSPRRVPYYDQYYPWVGLKVNIKIIVLPSLFLLPYQNPDTGISVFLK